MEQYKHKTNELHKFVILSQRLDLRNLNRHVALQNVSIYYTLENIRQQSTKTVNSK